MSKFREERFVIQRQSKSTGLWTFQVLIRGPKGKIIKSFSEKDYGTAKLAYDNAITYKYKMLAQLQNNTYVMDTKTTVQEVFDKYLETTTDSYSTKTRHISLFNRYVRCKDKPIQKVTKADIQNDLNAMVEKATDDTIMRVHVIWKNDIVNTALLNDYLVRDISLGIKRPVSHLIHTKKDTTTDRETISKVEELLLSSQKNKYNVTMIVYLIELLYYTGMRPGEAIALNRDDINFAEGYISITKELGSNMEKDNVIRRCKTPSSIRRVPITKSFRPILEEILKYSKTYDIFKREDGKWMDSTWVGNYIRYVLDRRGNGINFNLYRLRHNMATELISNNVDSRTTMDILGHSSFNMSLYYANSSQKQKEKALDLLS